MVAWVDIDPELCIIFQKGAFLRINAQINFVEFRIRLLDLTETGRLLHATKKVNKLPSYDHENTVIFP